MKTHRSLLHFTRYSYLSESHFDSKRKYGSRFKFTFIHVYIRDHTMTTLNSDCKLGWTWLAVYFLISRALLLYGSMGKEN